MEQVGPGGALESQISGMRGGALWLAAAALLTGLIVPTGALAHSGGFMLAKLEVLPGALQLEITADYGDNPLLQNAAETRSALREMLRVRTGSSLTPLAQLVAPRFESRSALDPTCPLYNSAQAGGGHQLLTAIWKWTPRAEPLCLEVPAGNPHDVVFWTVDPAAKTRPHWQYLIAGDRTAEVTPLKSRPAYGLAAALALGGTACLGLYLARRYGVRQSSAALD